MSGGIAVTSVRLVLDPHPTGRERWRALRRWATGALRCEATAGKFGRKITPDDVNWDSAPPEYIAANAAGSSGRSPSLAEREARGMPRPVSFSLAPSDDAAVSALAERWGCTRSEAVRRAVREASQADGEE